jgi:hypothetical protein
MSTNGERLRELIKSTELTQEAALYHFNNDRPKLFKPYSISAWKAFLAAPSSSRSREFSDEGLKRAEKIFSNYKKTA